MIDCNRFVEIVLQKIKTLPSGEGFEIATYKGDRKITLIKNADASYLLIEDGFIKQRYANIAPDKLKKLLKTLQKREFPRSNKLRWTNIGGDNDDRLP